MVGGELFMQRGAQGGATLLPIDSEHSAIFQSLPEDPPPGTRGSTRSSSPLRAGRFARATPATPARRDARGGLRPSQLGDGPQDLGRLGHHDEQGAGGDRGALPVRPAAGAARGRDPSAKRRSIRWCSTATPRWWRSSARPTCACRSPTAWPGRTASASGAQALDFHRAGRHELRVVRQPRPSRALSRACSWPGTACGRRAGHHGGAQRRQRGRGRGLPGRPASASTRSMP